MDQSVVAPPSLPVGGFSATITCEVTVSSATLSCGRATPGATSGMDRALVTLGGQGIYVQLTSTGTAYDGVSALFTSNVTVTNLTAQPMNTADGTTPDTGGVKVFFNSGPTATKGSGTVAVENWDGTGTFTGANQPFFKYNAGSVLLSGGTTAAKTWQFTVPNTVMSFAFTVYVTTQMPAASQLAFILQPSNAAAGAAITPAVQVAVEDALGNTVTIATTSITVAIGTNPANGTLSGTTTVAAVNGVATFSTLRLNPADTGYTLTASATGLSGASSRVFDVVTPVSAGQYQACGLTPSGAAYCWGDNTYGELGDGTRTDRTTPVAVSGGLTFASVSTGGDVTCGVTPSGAAYCWGDNAYGELGIGATMPFYSTTPVAVSGGLTFASVSAGANYSCGVTPSGAAYCWGYNGFGDLGDGTTTNSTTPVAVSGGLTFAAVASGGSTCGVTPSGAAYCWGDNQYGELGNGTTTNSTTPVVVSGSLTFAAVSAGLLYTCGVTPSGAAYCWGYNPSGDLGNGTTTNSTTPAAVSGGLTFAAVGAGAGYDVTCGVTPSGAAYCWGGNSYGDLGNGTITPSTTPVAVSGGLTFASKRGP